MYTQHWERIDSVPEDQMFQGNITTITNKYNRILLLGDSLIAVPSEFHDLRAKMRGRVDIRGYPTFNLAISYRGKCTIITVLLLSLLCMITYYQYCFLL